VSERAFALPPSRAERAAAATAPDLEVSSREEIETGLRYISRVRSMLPSRRALAALDADEARLREVLAALDAAGPGPEPADAAPARESERTMLDRLARRYAAVSGNGIRYARAEHVKVSAGHDARRVCDLMVMDLWTGYGVGRGPKLHGHEVKVSRADWLTELRDPSKALAFAAFCDFWWLVVSDAAIVRNGELPEGWGLLVAHGASLRVAVEAARRPDPAPIDRDLAATLMRSVTKTTLRLAANGDRATTALSRRMGLG
jgi:hypothetical protein